MTRFVPQAAPHRRIARFRDEVDAAVRRARDARSASDEIDLNDPTTWGKIQRNAPCPCGSGKKFKHCHGRFA